jgi:hypothetical protein
MIDPKQTPPTPGAFFVTTRKIHKIGICSGEIDVVLSET